MLRWAARRDARRSAAELLGAHAKTLAVRFASTTCSIDSTMVTVLPVPGLTDDTQQEKICIDKKDYLTGRRPQMSASRDVEKESKLQPEVEEGCPIAKDCRV